MRQQADALFERQTLAYALLPNRCMIAHAPRLVLFGLAALIGGCGHGAGSASGTTTTTAATLAAPPPLEAVATGRAHALVIESASCWLGGLWSDALGEKSNARAAGIRDRCLDVIEDVGNANAVSYYPMRVVDSETVGHLADHVRAVAAQDERDAKHGEELATLLWKIADASRDSVRARRAADVVKSDYDSSATAEDRRGAKVAAAPFLKDAAGLHELLAYRGPYEADARAIGLLMAIDRLEIARGLPKHLKTYATAGALADVFGVPAPTLSEDAAAPIPTGTWLAYLTKVASAAGHPIPDEVHKPGNREAFAWSGTLEGLADRLRVVHPSPEVAEVAARVVARLDAEAAGVRAAVAALPASAR